MKANERDTSDFRDAATATPKPVRTFAFSVASPGRRRSSRHPSVRPSFRSFFLAILRGWLFRASSFFFSSSSYFGPGPTSTGDALGTQSIRESQNHGKYGGWARHGMSSLLRSFFFLRGRDLLARLLGERRRNIVEAMEEVREWANDSNSAFHARLGLRVKC